MNRLGYISYLWLFCGVVFIVLLVHSCANKGYPEGGPKDKTPPKVVYETPASYTKNFNKKRVNIYFDEYVQLKDVNEKFIISPPQKKKPKPRLMGKYIQVDFSDSLRSNTTYSLDFADAIIDNNEGNPLGFYRYVFSTGNVIDSLELSGNVVNAESGEPVLNTYVFLYENQADSVPLRDIPNYIARTDSSGYFRLTNLRDTSYRIVAVGDNNRDYKYTPEGEMFAFMDSVVRPVVMSMSRRDTIVRIDSIVGRDTITSDSIVTVDYLAYGPNNLYLRLFTETLTQLYMVNDDRKERERLEFIFSIPAENDFKITLFDTLATEPLPENWYIKEHSAGNDTISIWIRDSLVYKKDTLHFIMNYLRTDSLGQRSLYADTNRYVFREKKESARGRKKEEAKKPEIQFLSINTNASGDFDIDGQVNITFDRPILREGGEKLQLFRKVDTLWQPMEFKITSDSLKIRRFYVNAVWEPEKEYKLSLDSATIYDIYGRHNDKFEKSFKIRPPEYYGSVILSVKGVTGDVVLQLYKLDGSKSDNGKRKYNVVSEKRVNKDGTVTFNFLKEGTYAFRAIFDTNKNGKWDTGLYLKKRQPESIVYLPVEINVKQNFDVEQEFDLRKADEQNNDGGEFGNSEM